jgi:hypothetical protein
MTPQDFRWQVCVEWLYDCEPDDDRKIIAMLSDGNKYLAVRKEHATDYGFELQIWVRPDGRQPELAGSFSLNGAEARLLVRALMS